jgi:WD40 repeat protein
MKISVKTNTAIAALSGLVMFAVASFAQGPKLVVQTGHTGGQVNAVVFSPKGDLLASGGADGTIKIWNVAYGEQLRTLVGHTQNVSSVAFSADGRVIASGSYDYSAKLWDAATGRELHTLNGHTLAVESIALSPTGNILATGSLDNQIKLWDVASGKELRTLTGHTGNEWRSVRMEGH